MRAHPLHPPCTPRTKTVAHCSFCKQCQESHDKDTTCEAYKQWQRENEEGIDTSGLNFKNCPECDTGFEKDAGCQHMDCPIAQPFNGCGYSFCWDCLSSCSPHGRAQQVAHGNAFHQNGCKWFESCCIKVGDPPPNHALLN